MNYHLRRLTATDLLKLDKIYNYLEEHPCCLKSHFRNNTKSGNKDHAIRIGAVYQRQARGSTAGMVMYRGSYQISSLSLKHPDLDNLLIEFMGHHNPEFKFNSVYITKNCQSKPHVDSGNVDTSTIVSIGKFEGGGLWVEEDHTKTTLFDIKKYSLEFDGSKHKHYTENFTGTRYSLIFF